MEIISNENNCNFDIVTFLKNRGYQIQDNGQQVVFTKTITVNFADENKQNWSNATLEGIEPINRTVPQTQSEFEGFFTELNF